MKKANIVFNDQRIPSEYLNTILVENVKDLISAHNFVFGSTFSDFAKKALTGLKKTSDITFRIESLIRNENLAPQTKICFINQLKAVLSGNFIRMNNAGGYFDFDPNKATITKLK
jgi:hypothetical protein